MNETRSTLALLLALVVPTTILACSQSGDGAAEDSALQYGERLQQVRTLSQQHQAEVHQASAPEDIADAEHRYADQLEPHLARMEQLVAEMDGCSGAAAYQRNLATLRDDHLVLQAMHQEHQAQMLTAHDVQTARASEGDYQARMHDHLELATEHHQDAMTHMGSQQCGMMNH